MKILVIVAAVAFIFILVLAITKARSATSGKISTYEHKSTFRKPDIEMVNKPAKHNNSDEPKEADDTI